MQYTATHYITLQHTTTHCTTLQHTATHCNTLQHIATHCNTLQHTTSHLLHCGGLCLSLQDFTKNSNIKAWINKGRRLAPSTCTLQHTATYCSILQRIATHCDTLQHTTTHCNTLQHTATHCSTLHIGDPQLTESTNRSRNITQACHGRAGHSSASCLKHICHKQPWDIPRTVWVMSYTGPHKQSWYVYIYILISTYIYIHIHIHIHKQIYHIYTCT